MSPAASPTPDLSSSPRKAEALELFS